MITRSVKSFWQRHLRSVGLAIKCEALQDETIQWAHNIIEEEASRPSQTHVVLFNSHEPLLARKFLNSGFPGISLIESNMKMANRQKLLTSSQSGIHVFHASIQENVLAPSKTEPLSKQSLARMLLSIKRVNNKLSLIIGCFPLISQQQTVISSMLTQLLIYSRRAAVEKTWKSRLLDEPSTSEQLVDFYPPTTVFDVTTPGVITFLNASQLTLLTCATDQDLDFYSMKNKLFSYLFNLFYTVRPLKGRNGYDPSCFYPHALEVTSVTHEQKLKALGYEIDDFYPVFIIPKKVKEILKELSEAFPGTSNELLAIELACWMDLIGKFTPTKDVQEQLRKISPDMEVSVNGKVSELTPEDIYRAFPIGQQLFRRPEGIEILKGFVGKLLKVKPGNYVD